MSQVAIKTLIGCCLVVFNVNFEGIPHVFLKLLFLTFNMTLLDKKKNKKEI